MGRNERREDDKREGGGKKKRGGMRGRKGREKGKKRSFATTISKVGACGSSGWYYVQKIATKLPDSRVRGRKAHGHVSLAYVCYSLCSVM